MQQWVEINKNKPEIGQDVWSWNGTQVKKDRMFGSIIWVSELFGGDKVTHWMPMQIPDPPKNSCSDRVQEGYRPERGTTERKARIHNGFLFTKDGDAFALDDIAYIRWIYDEGETCYEMHLKSNPIQSFFMGSSEGEEILGLLGE